VAQLVKFVAQLVKFVAQLVKVVAQLVKFGGSVDYKATGRHQTADAAVPGLNPASRV
jgi:hypothetical protein